MATHRKYDLAVVTGTYNDPQTGLEKKRYQNIGVEMETDDGGRFILLDPLINLAAVPRGNGKDRIMVSKFEVKENQNQNQQQPMNQNQQQPMNQNQQQAPNAWLNPNQSPMNPQQVMAAQQGQR